MAISNLVKALIPSKIKKRIKRHFIVSAPAPVAVPYEIRLADGHGLAGQIAMVTGGSGAIGRSICCHLAAAGATVYVCGMSEDKIDAVVLEISALGGTAYPQRLDISDEATIVQVIAAIAERHGKIDILVNCAGGSARSDHAAIVHQKTSVIDQLLTVNLRGAILCVREAGRIMMESGSGRIINISSIIGERGKANFSEYAACKGGIIAFTKSVAMELGQFGITVNCVSPGIVQRGSITPEAAMKIKKTNYMNDLGKPEDIAAMVSYLVSKEASFITGQNMMVDGGRSLGLKGD